MKKILIAATSLILVLLLAVYSLLQYRQYSSYQNSIHQQAALIFKINIDEIVKKRGLSAIKSDSRGFAVPANIFIYTVNQKSANTFFCSLPVTDTAVLRQYLKKALKVDQFKETEQGTVWGNSSDQRLRIAYNSHKLAISYSLVKENVNDILDQILAGKSFMPASDSRIRRMKQEDAPIIYDFKNYSGQASLTTRTLSLKGSFPLENLYIPDQAYRPDSLPKEISINAWLNADLKGLFKKDLHFKDYLLQKDTLLKYYDGYAAIELGNPVNQYQPVITYEYNDEFEKVERIRQKEVKVPEITLSLKGNAPALLSYLQKQAVINPDEQLNKELFPLYEVYSQHHSGLLQLSTSEKKPLPHGQAPSPYFLFAAIDFDKIRKQNQFPLINNYIKYFSKLELKCTKKNAKTGKIELEIKLNEL